MIPPHVYMSWRDGQLPPGMLANVELLRAQHPSLTFHVLDDSQCRAFIARHFDSRVVAAFDRLIPGAYKSDLWRYCQLFITGGIYVDIKMCMVGDCRLTDFCNDEWLVQDGVAFPNIEHVAGVYNAFMAMRPGSAIMRKCIDAICDNVDNKYYGNTPLYPTGPLLLARFVDASSLQLKNINGTIFQAGKPIMTQYETYRMEQQAHSPLPHYSVLWFHRYIYA